MRGQWHLKRQEPGLCLGLESQKQSPGFISRQGVYESPRPYGHRDQMCGHTPGKVAGQRETVKAEMNGLTPGLDRSPPSRWVGGQGGQSLKVLGRTHSFLEAVFSQN